MQKQVSDPRNCHGFLRSWKLIIPWDRTIGINRVHAIHLQSFKSEFGASVQPIQSISTQKSSDLWICSSSARAHEVSCPWKSHLGSMWADCTKPNLVWCPKLAGLKAIPERAAAEIRRDLSHKQSCGWSKTVHWPRMELSMGFVIGARPSSQQLRMMWPPLSEAVWALRLVNPRRDKKSVSWNPPRTGGFVCRETEVATNINKLRIIICQSHKIMQILQRWFLGSPSLREQLYATHINSSN